MAAPNDIELLDTLVVTRQPCENCEGKGELSYDHSGLHVQECAVCDTAGWVEATIAVRDVLGAFVRITGVPTTDLTGADSRLVARITSAVQRSEQSDPIIATEWLRAAGEAAEALRAVRAATGRNGS